MNIQYKRLVVLHLQFDSLYRNLTKNKKKKDEEEEDESKGGKQLFRVSNEASYLVLPDFLLFFSYFLYT